MSDGDFDLEDSLIRIERATVVADALAGSGVYDFSVALENQPPAYHSEMVIRANHLLCAILAALDGWTLVPRLDPESPDEWVAPSVWQGEVLRHEAEITELQMEFGDACLTMDEQRAEIARLRKALAAISEYDPPQVMKDDFAYDRTLAAIHEAARAALAGGSK